MLSCSQSEHLDLWQHQMMLAWNLTATFTEPADVVLIRNVAKALQIPGSGRWSATCKHLNCL